MWNTQYAGQMIRSFACPESETLFNDHNVRRFKNSERVAGRKWLYLHRATLLQDLRVPPGIRL